VVDVGSFAGAARRLGRATSVVSYAIANLESQLGVSLFDRESTRKPQPTNAGRAILSEARTITNGINGLRAKVGGLLQGIEAEMHLVLDVMLPAARVVDALKACGSLHCGSSMTLEIASRTRVRNITNIPVTITTAGPN
jgi:DNA-binding transcriptional LysR family regulator